MGLNELCLSCLCHFSLLMDQICTSRLQFLDTPESCHSKRFHCSLFNLCFTVALYVLHTKVSPHSSPSVVVLQEVLSAVIIIKLLSCCRLPERCSKSLWLFAPQILSTMVVRKANDTQKQSYTNPLCSVQFWLSFWWCFELPSFFCAINSMSCSKQSFQILVPIDMPTSHNRIVIWIIVDLPSSVNQSGQFSSDLWHQHSIFGQKTPA